MKATMMKAMLTATLFAMTLTAVPLCASAQAGHRTRIHPRTATWRALNKIEGRQARQQRRIRDGKVDGSLTRGEARLLSKQQRRIAQKLRRYLRDGSLRMGEVRRLSRMQDAAAADIYRFRHNRMVRFMRVPHRLGWKQHHRAGGLVKVYAPALVRL